MPLLFPGEKISMKRLARSACVCAHCLHVCMYLLMCRYTSACMCACKFAHVYVCADACLCLCKCAHVSSCTHVPACLAVCLCVCTPASGPAICDEGIPKQSRAARGTSSSLTGTENSRRAPLTSSRRVLAPHGGGAGKGQAPPQWLLGSHLPAPSSDNRPGATSGGERCAPAASRLGIAGLSL